jgi:hypothetical protein
MNTQVTITVATVMRTIKVVGDNHNHNCTDMTITNINTNINITICTIQTIMTTKTDFDLEGIINLLITIITTITLVVDLDTATNRILHDRNKEGHKKEQV